MSAYRSPVPRAAFVMHVGLRGWSVLVVVALLLMLVAFRTGHLFASLALFGLAWVFIWMRSKTIVVDPDERIFEIDGRRIPITEVIGVSARSQLELVISIAGGEDIVLVPAGLTDARVAQRARELRQSLENATDRSDWST